MMLVLKNDRLNCNYFLTVLTSFWKLDGVINLKHLQILIIKKSLFSKPRQFWRKSKKTQKVLFLKPKLKPFLAIFRAKYIYKMLFAIKNRFRKCVLPIFLKFWKIRPKIVQIWPFLGSIFTNFRLNFCSETTWNGFFRPNYILSTGY